jgi:hypothetical protein
MRLRALWIVSGGLATVALGNLAVDAWQARRVELLRPPGGVQIAGPSVLLRLQREGAPVFDLRPAGRPMPGVARLTPARAATLATGRLPRAGHPVAVLGDTPAAAQLARQLAGPAGARPVYLVPPHLLEYRVLPDVPQLTPRQLQARLGQVRVLDVSEADEFAAVRIPGSRHVAYETIQAGDRSALPPRGQSGQAVAVI